MKFGYTFICHLGLLHMKRPCIFNKYHMLVRRIISKIAYKGYKMQRDCLKV